MLCHTCTTTTTLSASCALNGLLHSLLGMLHSGSKWLKPAKNRFLMWFHEFLRGSFGKFTWFPIPVIACPSYSRTFMSNCCRQKKNQSISRILWVSFLAGFSYLAQLCAGAGLLEPSGKGKGCKQIAHCLWPKAALSKDLSVFEFLAFQVIFLY